MTDSETDTDGHFDETLIAAFFQLVADKGWSQANPARAAVMAGLDPAIVRARFPDRTKILKRLNLMADRHALSGGAAEDSVRANLFDLLMRRLDVLQRYRPGVIAAMRGLPFDPLASLTLASLTLRSMAWMLNEAGEDAGNLTGPARIAALSALWARLMHVWQKDGSEDLSITMVALDKLLGQAEKASKWLRVGNGKSRTDAGEEKRDVSNKTPEGDTVR